MVPASLSAGAPRATDLRVGPPSIQRRDVALSVSIRAAGRGRPVAPQQHGVTQTRSDLRVGQAAIQRWDVALSVTIFAEGRGRPVAPQQHGVTRTHLLRPGVQRGDRSGS